MFKVLQRGFFTALALGLVFTPSLVSAVAIVNPIGISDPRLIIARIIQAVMSIVGSLALLMFVYGGVLWITSFGEEKRINKGKTIIVWAVLGLTLIASAYVIVGAVINGLVSGNVNAA